MTYILKNKTFGNRIFLIGHTNNVEREVENINKETRESLPYGYEVLATYEKDIPFSTISRYRIDRMGNRGFYKDGAITAIHRYNKKI